MRALNVGGREKPNGFVGEWDTLQYSGNKYQERHMTIDHDLCSLTPIPKEDAYYDLLYSSHTFEHLLDVHLIYVLADCFRLLKKGGAFRVVAPDSMKLLNMYLEGQTINWKYGNFSEFDSFFYNTFQILSEKEKTIDCRKINEKEFRLLLDSNGADKTFDMLTEDVAEIMDEAGVDSSYHVNALHPRKIIKLLKEGGFVNIKEVRRDEGYTVMKNSPLNQTLPWGSFYIICQK